MKSIVVHLSDIHMDNVWAFEDAAFRIAEQINSFEADNVTLVISGDLTYSGEKTQYERIYNFIENIRIHVKHQSNNSLVNIVFVPGNHDIEYLPGETRSRKILKHMNDVDYFDNVDKEENRLSNFYSFSELFELPSNVLNDGTKINYKDITVSDNLTLRFYLLNNVLFSTYKDPDNDNSCGAVNIPSSIFDSIKLESNVVNFLVMHFPPYYFTENTYSHFKKAMPYLSYVLCGHIHDNELIKISSKNISCPISICPALYKEEINRLGMCVIVIDSNTNKVFRYSYCLSDNDVFIRESEFQDSSLRLINGKNPLLKKEEFCNEILYENFDRFSLKDYFVFPDLYPKKNNYLTKISNLDGIISALEKKHTLLIEGANQSGKTAILHKLFFDLDLIGVPVYFDMNCLPNIDEKNFESLIEVQIKKEYQDFFAMDVFNVIELKQRIALVDNFYINSESKKTLNVFSKYFGKIVFASPGTSYGMTEIEKITANSLLDEDVAFYELRPMVEQKRYELVEKRYQFICNESKKTISEDKIKIFYQKVQMILDKYVGGDANYPYFVNKVIASVLSDNISLSTENNRMYSRVYETYIGNVILDIFQNQEEAIVSQELLKIVAYQIFSEKSYCINYSDFHKIVNDFFIQKNIDNIDSDNIISKLLERKVIIRIDNNSYAFGSPDFLAYFAAKYYSELLNEDFDNNKSKIIDLLNKNYDDVVSKLLLFVVSLASKKTALYLISIAEEFVSNYEDFEVVQEEMALNDKEFEYIRQLTKKDRQVLREKISEKEAERFEREKNEYKKKVDEERIAVSDQELILCFKCAGLLDVVSAMLPDLKVVLDGGDQDRCIRILYKLPIILYRLSVGPIADNYIFVSKKVKEFFKDNDKEITDDSAKSIVIGYCRASFLSFINHTMKRAHTRLTEKDLRKKDFANNDTKRLIRLMASLHDDDAENTFEKYAKDYFQHFNSNPFAKNCISLMVRYYVSWYLSEEKAIMKKDFLKTFLKDSTVVETTIGSNLKGKKEKIL